LLKIERLALKGTPHAHSHALKKAAKRRLPMEQLPIQVVG
jgi:hypothetical protein